MLLDELASIGRWGRIYRYASWLVHLDTRSYTIGTGHIESVFRHVISHADVCD